MVQLIRWFAAPADIRLLPFLGIALLARIPGVIFSRGYEFLDHQYQYVDPAFHLATGSAFTVTEEWIDGLRSWVYPWLLSRVMRGVSRLGIEEPGLQMTAIRAVHAVFSLLPLAGLFDLLVIRERLRGARPLLLFLAFNWLVVYQGIQPNAPAVSCGLVVFAVCEFLCGGATRSLLAGLALGLAFCLRPQDGLFGIPMFVAGLLQRRLRDTLVLTCASLALLVVQGIVDLRTWGSFLHSVMAYVRFNLVEGGSAKWGTEPWWYYPAVVLGLAVPVVPMLVWRWIAGGTRRLPAVAACVAVPLLFLQMVPHKALRFVTPSLCLFTALWGLGALLDRSPGWARTVELRVAAFCHVAAFLVVSFAFPFKANIEVAQFVGSRSDNRGVVYLDLRDIDIGGYFYYRNEAPLLPTRDRASGKTHPLATILARHPSATYLVSRADNPPAMPSPWRAKEVARFTALLSFRARRALVVYRIDAGE